MYRFIPTIRLTLVRGGGGLEGNVKVVEDVDVVKVCELWEVVGK